DGVRILFVENDALYGRPGVYGEGGGEYPDNAERFGFFSRCLLPLAGRAFDGGADVLHLNDWQTGLAALELARSRGSRPGLTRSVFTIHNIGYQGVFPKEVVDALGIGWDAFTPEGLEFYDQVNFLKAGLAFSDLLTTVSPTYAKEIQGPEQGFGLDGMLRSRKGSLMGILNGVDYQEWSPEADPHLAARYSAEALEGKAACRDALCSELGIEAPAGVMVIGIVSRFAAQKGFDLLLEALPRLLEREIAFAILGSGEKRYEHWFERAAAQWPGRVGLRMGFDEALAHRIYAGSDAFLMPSLYEPCGLGQLYALRYGAVPMVRRTGGLADTVEPAARGGGTGFLFDGFSADSLLAMIDEAHVTFADRQAWRGLQERGMSKDFSWGAAARSYEAAYRRARGLVD
ncbi:MAG TPA: glycogen synthase, partial [Vulgatibacter sp.]